MVNYPVGDFLVRIKNGAMAGNREFEVVNTKFINSVAKALVRTGYLEEAKLTEDNNLCVRLRYHKKEPLLMDIKLVSKPGMRVYMNRDELSKKRGASIYIISTPDGVLSSREALKKGIGGEVIAEIW